MRIDVLTLFPRMFEGPMGESIIGKAFMTRLILKMFMLLIRLMLLKQSQQMIIKKLELMTVRV